MVERRFKAEKQFHNETYPFHFGPFPRCQALSCALYTSGLVTLVDGVAAATPLLNLLVLRRWMGRALFVSLGGAGHCLRSIMRGTNRLHICLAWFSAGVVRVGW